MHPRTFLSFWHIEMSNLPVGTFRRRALTAPEARHLIEAARESKALMCVAKEDLAAPYCEGDRMRHRQLCVALGEHSGVDVQLEDFFGDNCSNPLCFAEIGEHQSLLVVDCHYAFDGKPRPEAEVDGSNVESTPSTEARSQLRQALKMNIVPDSISF